MKSLPVVSFRQWISTVALLMWGLSLHNSANFSSGTDDLNSLKKSLQQKLDSVVEDQKFPGATLAVAYGPGKRIEFASGFSDKEKKERMKPDDRMFCGSTGKTLVSAVALKLLSKKKIGLDDLVSKFFQTQSEKEWFSKLPNSQTMTVRSLMNHTSGLPRYLFQKNYLEDLKTNPYRKREPVEALMSIGGSKATNEVGKGWSYSDTNYIVLGLIIEKVSGKKFYDVVNTEILTPLKLSDTIPAQGPMIKRLIPGYIGSNNFFGLPTKTVVDGKYGMDPSFEWCGGGFVTTSGDLASWLFELHAGTVLPPKTHQLLVSPVDFRTGQAADAGYGLGSFVWQSKNGLYYGHAGIMPGYLTQIEYSQKHKFAIAFQTNTDEGLGRNHHLDHPAPTRPAARASSGS